jgi:polyhydroxyalkanoate synthesis regulator phasin
MRSKLIIATTAGVLTLGGLAVAVPALADSGATGSAVDRITTALSGLVSDGSLTQEQADEVATTLDGAGIGAPGGPGGHGPGGGRLDLSAAATALGISEDDLRTALDVEGTSLADVAAQRGVAVDTVVDALVTAAQADVAAAVQDGDLTQEQADARLADLTQRVTERVQSDSRGPGHGPGRGGRGDGATEGTTGDGATTED